MTRRWIRRIATTTLFTTALGATGCGYILHPERRGNNGGAIDGTSLVFDILWLLPGIVPGVVALIVDFSSGAIYVGGGRMAVTIPPDGRIAVRLPESAQQAQLEVRLVTSSERVVARRTALVGPHLRGQVELQIDAAARMNPDEKMYLEVVTAGRSPTSVE